MEAEGGYVSDVQNEPQIITNPDLLELAEKARHVLIEYLPELRRKSFRYEEMYTTRPGGVFIIVWADKKLPFGLCAAVLKSDSDMRIDPNTHPHSYVRLDIDRMLVLQADNIDVLLEEKETFLRGLATMERWRKSWRREFKREDEELEAKERAEYERLKAKFER